MEEYFVEVHIEFTPGERRDPRGEEYGDLAAAFYDAVSEILTGDFDSPMTLGETAVQTHVYMTASGPTEAVTKAERLFSEAAERVWETGTKVSAERVITAAERDRELGALSALPEPW